MPPPRARYNRIIRSILAGGATVAGAYTGLSAVRWWYNRTLPPPTLLPPALDWKTHSMETAYGRSLSYVRPGTGTPIVVLHSFSPSASTYDVKPIAEHLADVTDRPIYALDWLGFGRSERPDIRYTPEIYGQQLYRLLNEALDAPTDLVATGVGCEYAAWMALQAAPLVRRLALVSPTGLTADRGRSPVGNMSMTLAEVSGIFDLSFYRRTGPTALREYYRTKIFADERHIPDDLVAYAARSARVQGAPHAPYYALKGDLNLREVAGELYGRLYRDTLLVTPESPGLTNRSFDLLASLVDQNARNLTHRTVPGGLLPHWEIPRPCFEALYGFLTKP